MSYSLRPHQQEAVESMSVNAVGQVIIPTGGGKTICMIHDSLQNGGTTVVVAPRILLAIQLCSEFMEHYPDVDVLHVHSGKSLYDTTTNPQVIRWWDNVSHHNNLIFTTYHSLHKVVESGITIHNIYYDEAHNSVRSDFYPVVEGVKAHRKYYFTATPKHSVTPSKPGMNNPYVYGNVICNIPAPSLVQGGYIVPPKVVVTQCELGKSTPDADTHHILESIDQNNLNKVLVCAKSVKQIVSLMGTSFPHTLREWGFSYMYISAQTGGVIDGKKVSRQEFFTTLNKWGGDTNKKFVVLHHSILSEGINVSGLEACIFLRNMNFTTISQSIGRVIRLHKNDSQGLRDGSITPGDTQTYTKPFGLCVVPVYTKATKSMAKSLQSVVDITFKRGEPAVSVVRK